jgi:S1-C subfamily serine protease
VFEYTVPTKSVTSFTDHESFFLPMHRRRPARHAGFMANELVNLSSELANAVERVAAGVVAVGARPRIGSSGVVWRQNLILTSSQGIRSEDGIKVLFPDGRVVEARLRGRDHGTDLALLEADTGSTKPLELAADTALKVGQLVLAVGRTADTGPIASFGIVSGVSGEWKSWRSGKLNPFIRLDVSVYPTSSGGAAVDASGNVIGLVSTGLSRTSVLAVTRTTIDRVALKLHEKGYVSHGFLGITIQPVGLPRDVKEKIQLDQESGIMLLGLDPDGPGAAGGLMMGDVLLAAGDTALTDPETLAEVLDGTTAGDALNIRVLRVGAIHELKVRVGERPRRGK